MSDPIDDLKSFFSSTKSLKAKGKVVISYFVSLLLTNFAFHQDFFQLHKQITDYKKTNKQRSEKLNEPIIKFIQFSCELAR